MKQVHIGKKIRKVFEDKGLRATEFARKINKSRENVYSIFRRKSIDTSLLSKISEVLDHDFFRYFITKNELEKELKRAREENKLLRELNTLLKSKASSK